MKPIILLLGMLLPFVGQQPLIRHVPQIVDPMFARRGDLCPDVPYLGGVIRPNDARHSVAQWLGSITSVDVHQFGRNFADFAAVRAYLQQRLAEKPRVAYRYLPWAEGTPLAATGVLATLHFAAGPTGMFEATQTHVCAQDSSGTFWWFRLVPSDVWPPR